MSPEAAVQWENEQRASANLASDELQSEESWGSRSESNAESDTYSQYHVWIVYIYIYINIF